MENIKICGLENNNISGAVDDIRMCFFASTEVA